MSIHDRRTSLLSQKPKVHRTSLRSPTAPSPKRSRQDRVRNTVGQSFAERSVAFTLQERCAHTHVIGATGTGKSKFLELLMRQDMRERRTGFCLLDPHGSLYHDVVLYACQKHGYQADRFILFNPAEQGEHVVGFNPIPDNAVENIDYILDMLISGCLKAWGQDNTDRTPRITKWLENIFYTIIVNDLTLVETAPLLSISKRSQPQRERLLAKVTSDVVLDDWEMFRTSTNTQKQALIEGAANRLRKFLRNEAIRNVIGQKQRTLDLQKIMDEGKILLVNLNGSNRISHENTKLLGIMIVNEFFRVAKLRDPRDRALNPFFLYVDEFANFITRDIARTLEECRKFKLFMILAHQHLAQLKEEDEYLYASVLTNCKNKVVFGGLSTEDVRLMTDEVVTGFVNLKSIKDERYTTKVRHHETTRVVRSVNRSESTGTTTGTGESTSQSRSSSESQTHSTGTSVGQGETHGRQTGATVSRGHTRGTGTTETHSESETVAHGTSESTSKTMTRGESHSRSQGHTTGSAETHGTSTGQTRGGSNAHASNWSQSQGTTHTDGVNGSETHGTSESTSSSRSDGRSSNQGRSSSNSDGRGGSQGYSSVGNDYRYNHGDSTHHSHSSGMSESHGETHQETEGTTNGSNHSTTSGWSRSDGTSSTQSQGGGETETSSWSESKQENQSRTNSQSRTESDSHGTSRSQSETRGRSRTTTQSSSTGRSQGRSENESRSETHGTSEGESHGHSTSRSEQESRARGTARSSSESLSASKSFGRSQSESHGSGETIVPFLEPEEYLELSSRTFWSKDELHYMEMAKMKHQETGVAFIKIGASPPIQTKIEHVQSVRFHPRFSPRKIAGFEQKVITAHGQYYTRAMDARHEYEVRQELVFGEPLRFDEKPLTLNPEMTSAHEEFEDQRVVENPFND